MKRLLLSFTFVGLGAISAHAETPARDWSGAHIGIFAGVAKNHSDSSGIAEGTGYWAAVDVPTVSNVLNQDLGNTAGTAGINLGYNYQKNNAVLGADLNVAYFNYSDSQNTFSPYPTNPTGFAVRSTVNADWLITLTPKIGYAFGDFLLEANAGLAATKLETSYDLYFEVNNRQSSASNSEVQYGWTAGTGLSYAINDNWSVQGLYRYLDFGDVSASNPVSFGGVSTTSRMTQSFDLTSHVFTVGLQYKF